jgi:hypothetical protein
VFCLYTCRVSQEMSPLLLLNYYCISYSNWPTTECQRGHFWGYPVQRWKKSQHSYNNCISWQKLYYVSSISCCLLCIFLLFYILYFNTNLENRIVYKLAGCAAILFIYVRSRSGGQQFFTCCPAGSVHCICLKPRDHKSANHIWCSPSYIY